MSKKLNGAHALNEQHTKLVPKCSRTNCKAPATRVPCFQLYPSMLYQDPKPIDLVIGLPLCVAHEIDLHEASRIVNLEHMANAVEQQGRPRPDLIRTVLIHISLTDPRYTKLIQQRKFNATG